MAGVVKAREGIVTNRGGHDESHGMHVDRRVIFDGSRDYQHEAAFARITAQLRYSSTPLPGPFPPLAKQRTGQLSRALAPQSSSTSLGTGTIISDAPSATSVRTRHSGALETLRVHLPLGTSPRVSHRVLRDSCHGQMSWDRTNSATHRTAVESIPNKGPHPVAHARAVAPWQVNSTSSHAGENPGKGHWREWQSNPEARFDQSPRSQRRLMTAKQLFHRQMSAQESKMGPIRAEVAQHHQAAQTPWREGYTSPRVVARPSAGQWTPAGRGVLGGWYTPRMSESDRQAAHDEAVLSEAARSASRSASRLNEEALRARDENVAATHLRTAEILWKAGDRLAAAAAYCKAEQNGSGTSIGPQAEAQRARRCSFTREMIDALLKQPQDREDYAALLDWFKVLMALMQPHGPPSRIVDMVEKASVRAEASAGVMKQARVMATKTGEVTEADSTKQLDAQCAALELALFFRPRNQRLTKELRVATKRLKRVKNDQAKQ